jgi:hypothetical protein
MAGQFRILITLPCWATGIGENRFACRPKFLTFTRPPKEKLSLSGASFRKSYRGGGLSRL